MAFNQTDKNEIEKIVKKEIKSFLESNSLRQFEDKLVDILSKEIKKGKIEKDLKMIIVKSLQDFYEFIYNNKSMWGDKLKK